MTNQDDVSAEEMYRRAKKGWFYSMLSLVAPTVVSYVFLHNLKTSLDPPSAFIVADEQTIVTVGAPLALAIFVGGLILRAIFTRRGVNQQDRQLVLKGVTYGVQASGLIAGIGFVLGIFFWYQYFFLWIILGVVSLLLHFPRLKPFLDSSYKQF